jgi:hypothetical protein
VAQIIVQIHFIEHVIQQAQVVLELEDGKPQHQQYHQTAEIHQNHHVEAETHGQHVVRQLHYVVIGRLVMHQYQAVQQLRHQLVDQVIHIELVQHVIGVLLPNRTYRHVVMILMAQHQLVQLTHLI